MKELVQIHKNDNLIKTIDPNDNVVHSSQAAVLNQAVSLDGTFPQLDDVNESSVLTPSKMDDGCSQNETKSNTPAHGPAAVVSTAALDSGKLL